MATYNEFIQNNVLQTGLTSILTDPLSLFMKDIYNKKIKYRPLFLKYLSKIEQNNTLDYTRTKKINPLEEDIEEFAIRTLIANWINDSFNIRYGVSGFPVIYWERTIPTRFNVRYEVSVFPEGPNYSLITFGVENIIEYLKNYSTPEEQKNELDRLKQDKKITTGRLTIERQSKLSSGDVVFFCCQSFISLPCISRDMFIYTRKMIYDELDI